MPPDQVAQIQASFAKVVPMADQAAALFYGRLFETAPETKPLFQGDMVVQGEKLMAAIATVVENLGQMDAIAPAVTALAQRHVTYGVKPDHYTAVGAALLWTLEQGLGEEFTPGLRASWTEAYGALAGLMIGSAYPDPAKP